MKTELENTSEIVECAPSTPVGMGVMRMKYGEKTYSCLTCLSVCVCCDVGSKKTRGEAKKKIQDNK